MTKKTVQTILQFGIMAALCIGIIWYMFGNMSDAQKSEMFDSMKQTKFIYFLPVLLASMLSHIVRALRWNLMLEPLNIFPKFLNTLSSLLVGYLINLVPPRAGELAKCTLLARYEKLPAEKIIGTIVAERAWDMICFIIVIFIGLFWQANVLVGNDLKAILTGHLPSSRKIFITIGVIIAIIIGLYFLYKKTKQGRIGKLIMGLRDGVSSIFKMKKRGLFLFYSVAIWAMYLIQIKLSFLSMPMVTHLGWGCAWMCLVFGSVGIIAAPGGIGLYPYLISLLLQMGYNLTIPHASAYSWVSWLAVTSITIFLGIVAMLFLPIYNRKRNEN